MIELFRTLGHDIEERWRQVNCNEHLLPAIAADALRRHDIPSKIDAWEIIPWVLGSVELPIQKDITAKFGDPPITLFVGSRFYIDVYFWFEGTTATHQHGFSGAFQVLTGSSIHSWYEFEPMDKVNSFMEFGEMSLKVCELLTHGDIQEISGGRQYIHSLFHLDHPSATIVVRTDRSPLDLPQFSYHKPDLAIDPFYDDQTLLKKIQSFTALIRAGRDDADSQIEALLRRTDLHSSYLILSNLRSVLNTGQLGEMFGLTGAKDRFRKFLDIVADVHGDLGRRLAAVFVQYDLIEEMVKRRGYVRESEHRFFLALLLNADGRDRIFSLIRQRFPDDDPKEKILDWVFDLAQTRVVGVDTPNAIGIADLGNLELSALELLLDGTSPNEIAERLSDEYADVGHDQRTAATEKITTAAIFSPLLRP